MKNFIIPILSLLSVTAISCKNEGMEMSMTTHYEQLQACRQKTESQNSIPEKAVLGRWQLVEVGLGMNALSPEEEKQTEKEILKEENLKLEFAEDYTINIYRADTLLTSGQWAYDSKAPHPHFMLTEQVLPGISSLENMVICDDYLAFIRSPFDGTDWIFKKND